MARATVALDGHVTLRSATAQRTIPSDEFFVSVFTTARLPGEIITGLSFAARFAQHWGFAEFQRRTGDFAIVAVAVACQMSDSVVTKGVCGRGRHRQHASSLRRPKLSCWVELPLRRRRQPPWPRRATKSIQWMTCTPRRTDPRRLVFSETHALFTSTVVSASEISPMPEINVVINGAQVKATVPDRLLLSDFIRDDQRLTGTHVGCEHGYCGSCTVLLDGAWFGRA